MSSTMDVAPDTATFTAAAALQRVLPEIVALSMTAKQVHWNAAGPSFLVLHDLTQNLALDTSAWADRIAERSVALGFAVDARPRTVAANAAPFPGGRLSTGEAIAELIAATSAVAASARSALDDVADTDPVANDIFVTVVEGLDKYRWMLTAQGG